MHKGKVKAGSYELSRAIAKWGAGRQARVRRDLKV